VSDVLAQTQGKVATLDLHNHDRSMPNAVCKKPVSTILPIDEDYVKYNLSQGVLWRA